MFDKVEAKEDRKATVFNNDEVDIDFKLIRKLNRKFNSTQRFEGGFISGNVS